MHLRTTTLVLLLTTATGVNSRPSAPTPSIVSPRQVPGIPGRLSCPNGGPTCPNGMYLLCANGELTCSAVMFGIHVGKCSDCKGSICALGPDAYPGDSYPGRDGSESSHENNSNSNYSDSRLKIRADEDEEVIVERERTIVVPRRRQQRHLENHLKEEKRQWSGGGGQYCQAQWECSCVSWDGKGYFTSGGAGTMCPVQLGSPGLGNVIESCDGDSGYLCIFGCRSDSILKGFTNQKCDSLFPGTRAVCRAS